MNSRNMARTQGGSDDHRGKGRTQEDNRANQLNPNHDAYWQSRGHEERPDDWASRPDDPYSRACDRK